MKKHLLILLLTLISMFATAGKYAREANENPFLDGQLNAKYQGEVVAIAGDVITKMMVDNHRFYLLDLKTEGLKNIWVTSFIQPQGKPTVDVGDNIIFQGYISTSSDLDPSGKLHSAIKSQTLLLAIRAKNNGA
ncbi:hypothetical protein [Paraferrimonas sp. SM1919]|uniref:hypothetical protein n=1 Tax=Paraferrimonas sp. SM1919 TaxID=2662263 RepID=UPI0013D7602A|nr:hypothetical protein [Paraferrimonas sp. SM1919]